MDDRQIDKMLSASALRQVELLKNSTPSDEELAQIHCSRQFKDTIQNSLVKSRRKQICQMRRSRITKIAASIIIVLSVTFGVIMSVSASRNNVVHFFQHYFSFNSGKTDNWHTDFNAQIINSVHDVYLPTWIPEGFKAEESLQGKNDCTITYKSPSKTIRFSQEKGPNKLFSDSELKVMSKVILNDQTYYYGEKGSKESVTRKLLWNSDQSTYIILSDISKDDIVKFATNLTYKKG